MNPLNAIKKRLRKIFKNRKLVFSMNNIVHITGLSRTRLNYWQKKGYIKSLSHKKNSTRVYAYPTLIKIELIQSYLKSGFPLEFASRQASKGEKYGMFIQDIVKERLQSIDDVNGKLFANFGTIKNEAGKTLYFVKDNQGNIIAKVK